MFNGGPSPEPPSEAELKAAVEEANLTVRKIAIGSVLLYLSPFVIDYVKKLV